MENSLGNWPNSNDRYNISYTGDGDGSATFSSDVNNGAERTATIVFVDGGRSVRVTRTLRQAGKPVAVDTYTRLTYIECDGQQYIDTGYVLSESDAIEAYYDCVVESGDKFLFFADL